MVVLTHVQRLVFTHVLHIMSKSIYMYRVAIGAPMHQAKLTQFSTTTVCLTPQGYSSLLMARGKYILGVSLLHIACIQQSTH